MLPKAVTPIAPPISSEPGLGLPVLGWTLPRRVARQLNAEFGTAFTGHDDPGIALRLAVDRGPQRRAIACHQSQSADNPVLWRRLELLGNAEYLTAIGWPALISHERRIARLLREGLAVIPGVRLLGPAAEAETLPVATFTVEGVPHALVAARLAAEEAIGVRHGCFCAHPYLIRLLGLTREEVHRYREQVGRGDRSAMPGAVRASAGLNTTDGDIGRLRDAAKPLDRAPHLQPELEPPLTCGNVAKVVSKANHHLFEFPIGLVELGP